MGEYLTAMPIDEIERNRRWWDWFAVPAELVRQAVLFSRIVWRLYEPPDPRSRISLATALSVSFQAEALSDALFYRALRRACRARGYLCVPCNLRWQRS